MKQSRLLGIQKFISSQLMDISFKEGLSNQNLSVQDRNLQTFLSKMQELLFLQDDLLALKAGIFYLQQIPIKDLEAENAGYLGKIPGLVDLQKGLTRSWSSIQEQVSETIPLARSGLARFGKFSSLVLSAGATLFTQNQSDSDANEPQEIELQPINFESKSKSKSKSLEAKPMQESDEGCIEDFFAIEKDNSELRDFQNIKENLRLKSFLHWMKEKNIYRKSISKKEHDALKQVLVRVFSQLPASILSYEFQAKDGEYFSAEGLNILVKLYQLSMHFYPKWMHTFSCDIDGYVAKDSVDAWYASKSSSANHAIEDFKRNFQIASKLAGSENECLAMIDNLINSANYYSVNEKESLTRWMRAEGGQENNFDLKVFDARLPNCVGAESIEHNWYVKDGRIYLETNLHIKRLQREVKDDSYNELLITLVNTNGEVVELNSSNLAMELEKAKRENIESLPLMNWKYTIMLEVVNRKVTPKVISAELISYSHQVENPFAMELAQRNEVVEEVAASPKLGM